MVGLRRTWRGCAPCRVSRRGALAMAGGAFLSALPPLAVRLQAQEEAWRESAEVQTLVGEASPVSKGIELDLPQVSEDSDSVPLGLYVETPEDRADFVEKVHVIAPANPFPEVAEFHFTPQAGRAEITTRVRLDRSQTVVALARMRSGKLRLAEAHVRVSSKGCYLSSTGDWSQAMQTRVRTPTFEAGVPAEVTALIKHPMENGLGTEATGEKTKQRIIERFEACLGGCTVLAARFGPSLAADPYLRFYLAPQASATLLLRWTEDTGRQASERVKIQLS